MNNYNTSTTGISIDLIARYDTEQSQWNFDEAFTRLTDGVYWYTSYSGIEVPLDFDDLFEVGNVPTETVFEILQDIHSYDKECLEETFETNDEAITELTNNYSFPEDIEEYAQMLDDYDIPHTKLFVKVASRGYSQGDYCTVLIPTALRKEWGLDESISLEDHCKEEIDNLLWDCPMSVRIEINGEEYCSETFDGAYERCHYPIAERNSTNHLQWDEDVFIEEVVSEFNELDTDILREELEELVPSELKYD